MKKEMFVIFLLTVALFGCASENQITVPEQHRQHSEMTGMVEKQIDQEPSPKCDERVYYFFNDLLIEQTLITAIPSKTSSCPPVIRVRFINSSECLEDLSETQIDFIHGYGKSLNLSTEEVYPITITDWGFFDNDGYSIYWDKKCRYTYTYITKEGKQIFGRETEVTNKTEVCWQ